MSVILRADNRSLIKGTKYSYSVENCSSGVSSIVIANTDGFNVNDYVLIGNFGSENAEIVQISTVATATGTLALVVATRFAHSESTRVTVIQYNKVRFFWTARPTVPNPSASPITENEIIQNSFITETKQTVTTHPNTAVYTKTTDPTETLNVDTTPPILFDYGTPLAYLDISAGDYYTTYIDDTRSTGYGWFAFYNAVSITYSALSNPIPYAGFPYNTVKELFSGLDSCLNAKELRLISLDDKYTWANEGFSRMVNELNLGNWEYNSSGPITLTIQAGVTEYLLPDDFSNLLYINEANGDKINHYAQTFEPPFAASVREYEVRGRYLVFRPSPVEGSTVTLAYLKNSIVLKDLSDVINLPDRGFYCLKDFMLFRAHRKLGNLTESTNSLAIFEKGIEKMKIFSIKRDDSLDSWSVDDAQNC